MGSDPHRAVLGANDVLSSELLQKEATKIQDKLLFYLFLKEVK